jgi:hypothetical protein
VPQPAGRAWYQFAIGRVSFFITDTRSQRDRFGSGRPATLHAGRPVGGARGVGRRVARPGFLVLDSRSISAPAIGAALNNFTADYARLCGLIERSLAGVNGARTPHDIVVLSGDIHTGRFAAGYPNGIDAPVGVPEIIASPAAMIHPGSSEFEEPEYRFTRGSGEDMRVWTVRGIGRQTDDDARQQRRPGAARTGHEWTGTLDRAALVDQAV